MQVLAWKSPQIRVCTRLHCQKPAASLSYLLFWVSMCHKLGSTQWFPDKSQDIRNCKQRLKKTRGNSLVVRWLGLHTLIAEASGAGSELRPWQRSWGRRLGIRKGGIEPQESPWKSSSIYPQNQSLPTFCFVLSPAPLTLRGAVPHYLSLKKELAYSSS